MEKYVTISIKPSTKEKLKLVTEYSNKSYDEVLKEVLGDNGVKLNDVIEIERDKVAMTIRYVEFENDMNDENIKIKDITYEMLRTDPIGSIYMANENPNRKVDYSNNMCEICFRRNNDVIVMVSEVRHENGEFKTFKEVLHFMLF